MQNEDRGHERQRDRHDADQRRSPVEEEDSQDEHDEEGTEHECRRQVMDRLLDEARGPEDGGIDLEAGEPRAHLVDGLLHPSRDLEGVPPWQLLDHEHETGTVVDDGVAGQERSLGHHLRHVADAQRVAVPFGEDDVGKVFRCDDRQLVADSEPLVGRVDEAPGADEPALGELQDPRV